jgi:hypothetical protein
MIIRVPQRHARPSPYITKVQNPDPLYRWGPDQGKYIKGNYESMEPVLRRIPLRSLNIHKQQNYAKIYRCGSRPKLYIGRQLTKPKHINITYKGTKFRGCNNILRHYMKNYKLTPQYIVWPKHHPHKREQALDLEKALPKDPALAYQCNRTQTITKS